MGVALKNFGNNVQDKFKSSTKSITLLGIKLFSGFMIGLTIALVGQEIMGYETLSFILIVSFLTGIFMRISKSWGYGGIFIFDLIAVLIAMLLRMYIVVAPGL